MINSLEELYKTVDKHDLFTDLNKYMEAEMKDEDSAINLLIDSKISRMDGDVSIIKEIDSYDLVGFEDVNMMSFVRRVFRDYNVDADTGALLDGLVTDYTQSDEVKDVVNVANDMLQKRYEQMKDKNFVNNADEISNVDDNIGDKTVINDKIDLGNRDGNFIIIDGKVITGDDNATHSQLINEYIKKYLNQDIDEDLNVYRVRDTEMFDQIQNDEPVVFGHIVNNVAFIEQCENCTADSAVDDLKNQCHFKKIYQYDASDDTITRLAKRR